MDKEVAAKSPFTAEYMEKRRKMQRRAYLQEIEDSCFDKFFNLEVFKELAFTNTEEEFYKKIENSLHFKLHYEKDVWIEFYRTVRQHRRDVLYQTLIGKLHNDFQDLVDAVERCNLEEFLNPPAHNEYLRGLLPPEQVKEFYKAIKDLPKI